MSAAIVAFPLERWALPADARQPGRHRHVFVEPLGGEWACWVADTDGGYMAETDGSKAAAMRVGLELVLSTNAEMSVRNSPEGGSR